MVKFGVRKPNLKKSVKAQTTGRMKRSIKKSVNPLYGKKGMGWVNNPKKAAYNKVYNKTTIDTFEGLKNNSSSKFEPGYVSEEGGPTKRRQVNSNLTAGLGCIIFILYIVSIAFPPLFIVTLSLHIYLFKRVQKEKRESEERFQREEFEFNLMTQYYDLEAITDRLYKIKKLNVFFDEIKQRENIFLTIQNTLESSDYELPEEEILVDQEKFDNQTTDLLIDFITRYEESSFEKATKLKTAKGQQNNYQRSLDDLKKYDHCFDSEVKKYLEARWQEI